MNEFSKKELLHQIDTARAAMEEQFADITDDEEKQQAEYMRRAWAEIRRVIDVHG